MEESWRRNHGGIMDVELWKSNEDQSWRRHLGSIWEPSRRHLGNIWAFRIHLGCIWETFGGLEAEEASGRHLEVRSHKSATPLSYNAKVPPTSCFYYVFLRVGVTKHYYLL